MITVPAGIRVLVATKPVDFRRGGDALAALVREALGEDPFSGTIFVFRCKRADHTSFCIPIAICCRSLSLASAAWGAAARSPATRPTG